ncbi:alpha/beta fold hydrolase [Streptococcus merionis]|uniref:alpha/beta fold hydrolase n=1 Tax=Streptococcus merionis TaxID=400065 RepID=UPI003518C711
MKLIFLHGLGQRKDSWDKVIAELPEQDCLALDLFPNGQMPDNFDLLRQQVLAVLNVQTEPFVLVGLSLGGMLALSFANEKLPLLKGLIISAGQYKLMGNLSYRLQGLAFKCLPASFFKKQGLDKATLISFYQSISDLDMTAALKGVEKPVLAICGEKDKINLKTSRMIAQLAPQGEFRIVPEGNHTLNKDFPVEFSQEVQAFMALLNQ